MEMLLRKRKREPIDIDFTLRRVFGKKSFRPIQRDVIQAVIEGHDVFLQAATSFGKSLCFQLPAIVGHGVTIVVSPLLALMMDQVAALEANGIPVATINSTTAQSRRRAILTDLLSGHPTIRLLYVTPEFCQTDSFRRHLQTVHLQGELNRIAIDEAHCVSEWGHDFRPAYKALSWLRKELTTPLVPITALTATATPRVRADIIHLLGLDSSSVKLFQTPSARPNIHYEVRYLSDYAYDPTVPETSQVNDVLIWLKAIHDRRMARLSAGDGETKGHPVSPPLPPLYGIIYVPLRSISSELASSLSASPLNIKAVAYHAGLPASERAKIQSTWSAPSKRTGTSTIKGKKGDKPEEQPAFYIVVATNAFGMGIDNAHVRFVIHWTPPRSFEGFVQESGRAGRDGRAAVSLVYYNDQERERVVERISRDQDTGFDTTTSTTKRRYDNATIKEMNVAKMRNREAMLDSFNKVVRYCLTTTRCRHEVIQEFSGDVVQHEGTSASTNSSSICDFACDFCKEGTLALTRRKELMSPENSQEEEDMIDRVRRPQGGLMNGLRFASGLDFYKADFRYA
ncbi:hypothetical protein AJ80_00735 [Polytolypa hystricis UAMH7299]|uniref:ATP-dependent DNA helicase n=1 Tax=Polytolypa hystricis (strain UAMH7299) TaxID=1447883 RepID=A0A2B7YTX0_POLH7|nr:hypothetical protein AJ80_00735 [Polytolypa hystricis UAMH7299]